MNRYAHGAYRVGLDAAAPDRAIVIRVHNVQDVVKKQAGDLASLARRFVPGVVDDRFYQEMVKQISDEFKSQGVLASVDVVAANAAQTAVIPKDTTARDVGIGVATVIFTGLMVQRLVWRKS